MEKNNELLLCLYEKLDRVKNEVREIQWIIEMVNNDNYEECFIKYNVEQDQV